MASGRGRAVSTGPVAITARGRLTRRPAVGSPARKQTLHFYRPRALAVGATPVLVESPVDAMRSPARAEDESLSSSALLGGTSCVTTEPDSGARRHTYTYRPHGSRDERVNGTAGENSQSPPRRRLTPITEAFQLAIASLRDDASVGLDGTSPRRQPATRTNPQTGQAFSSQRGGLERFRHC